MTDHTAAQGLSTAEAQERLRRDGPNELPAAGRVGVLQLLGDIAREPMFLLLVACGAVYLTLGDRYEALMLLGFVGVVIAITYAQRRRSERALDALRDLSSPRALVVRDGQTVRVASRELVVGDVVLLAEGDRVPADLFLVEAPGLSIDESLLTGESVPVLKRSRDRADPDRADPLTQAFSGTLVTQGAGRGVVQAIGEHSALGRIGVSLRDITTERTPVQQETQRIVTRLATFGLALATLLALAWGLSRGEWLHGLLAGLTLAMAILPEELPVVLTIFLGLGAWRLARERVLSRSMPAVELLGATTVLCVDKTGTLTQNRMAVRRLWAGDATHALKARPQAGPDTLPEPFHPLLEYAVLASHRRAVDPMEQAIGAAGQRLLAGSEHLHTDWTLVDDYPLSRELLAMSRVWQSPDRQERLVAAKGAPEAIFDLCHLDADRLAALGRQVEAMAPDGLRVLGVARAVFRPGALPEIQHDFAFEFVGLVGLEDPLRPDVPAAIGECHGAGIRVVMITGDHPHTAMAMARQAGLNRPDQTLSGPDLATLDDAALAARLADTDVFCRIAPAQKLRLVRAFQAQGEVVAMTGDGVNDAPALKAAHIGVAMGARGTDVAREAAHLVLLEDDFASLVTAVRHGRRVFTNLRKAFVFVLAAHLPIIGLSLAPVLMGWPLLLLPVHILFLELIIDPACSVVFEAEPLEADAMRQPPRSPQARLFDAQVLWRGLAQGAGLLAATLLAFAQARSVSGSDEVARALAFAVLVVGNLALIQVNRHWSGGPAVRPWNVAFGWIGGAALALLALVLWVPPVATRFAFAPPSAGLLALGAALCAGVLGWCVLVRRWTARPGSAAGRHAPT